MNRPGSGTMPRVLSIAGTDPTGGAGIQADLKSIAAGGGYGMAVVTALVAQNTHGVQAVHVPPVDFLAKQLASVSDDVTIDAVKLGMLVDTEVITCVTDWLARVRPPLVVLDPVMIATSGDRLLDAAGERSLRDLAAHVDLITPNVPELAVLAGAEAADSADALLAQAEAVSRDLGVLVLAKGGHLSGTEAPDALVDARSTGEPSVVHIPGERVATRNTHGTGCSYSSAVATRVAAGMTWEDAVREAKRWLTESLRAADDLDVGSGHGPISHLAGLWARGGLETAPAPHEVRSQWWSDTAPLRQEIEALEFVRALADGSLEREAFTWYLAQDALYLREFGRALAAASALAPTSHEQELWARSAADCVAVETELHASWLPQDGLFDADPGPVTSGYTNSLLAEAARGDYPTLIAALLPCFWVYLDTGQRLLPAVTDDHPYAEWIRTYADAEFEATTERAIDVVTAAAADADPATRARMRRAFHASTRWEHDFFAAPLPAGTR